MEQTLQESEEKLSTIVECIAEEVIVCNLESYIVQVNNAAVRLHGFLTEEELLGRHFPELISKKNRTSVSRCIARALEKRTTYKRKYTCLRKDGTQFYAEMSIAVLKVESGNPRGFVVVISDISERKQAEEALQKTEERLRHYLSESTRDWAWEISTNMVHTYANPKVKDVLGYEPDEIIGKTAFEFMLPQDAKYLENNLQAFMESQRPFSKLKNTMLHKDGRKVVLESSGVPFFDADGRLLGYRGIDRDITERMRWKDDMHIMQFYISAITRAHEDERKHIARELHDETIQSIASLALEVEAISKDKRYLSEETIQRLEQLQDNAYSIMETVRRFSHELRPDVLDQMGLIPALELVVGELSKGGSINTKLDVAGSERRLSTDTELTLFRIAQEAAHNILKHSKATEAILMIEFYPKKVRMSITDNGKGFEVPQALSDFISQDKLGIIGMQERVHLLGGSLLVESQVDHGTKILLEVGI